MDNLTSFSKLEFGEMSADQEVKVDENLLIKGFYDEENIIESILEGKKWLILGYKGSGKSMIGEKLKLLESDDFFASYNDLATFSYKSLRGILTGNEDEDYKFVNGWKVVLITRIFELLIKDQSLIYGDDKRFKKIIDFLNSNGMILATEINSRILKLGKLAAKGGFSNFFEISVEGEIVNNEIGVLNFIRESLDVLKSLKSYNRYMIIIDGLDEVISRDKKRLNALPGLLNAVNDITNELFKSDCQVNIIVLCRTDIFDKLSDPNLNKIKQNNGFTLTWWQNNLDDKNGKLIKFLNMRGNLSEPKVTDIITEYFPEKIHNVSPCEFMLSHTRLLPRDLIMLIKNMQQCAEKITLTEQEALRGLGRYSSEYFIPEIKNELAGYVDESDITSFISIVSSMRRREFSMTDIERHKVSMGETADLPQVLKHLYDCSAVGNLVYSDNNNLPAYTWKFRNPHTSINLEEKIILHRGLWHGLRLT